jgi:hypothetical protein
VKAAEKLTIFIPEGRKAKNTLDALRRGRIGPGHSLFSPVTLGEVRMQSFFQGSPSSPEHRKFFFSV